MNIKPSEELFPRLEHDKKHFCPRRLCNECRHVDYDWLEPSSSSERRQEDPSDRCPFCWKRLWHVLCPILGHGNPACSAYPERCRDLVQQERRKIWSKTVKSEKDLRKNLNRFKDDMSLSSDRNLLLRINTACGGRLLTIFAIRHLNDKCIDGLEEASSRQHMFDINMCFATNFLEIHITMSEASPDGKSHFDQSGGRCHCLSDLKARVASAVLDNHLTDRLEPETDTVGGPNRCSNVSDGVINVSQSGPSCSHSGASEINQPRFGSQIADDTRGDTIGCIETDSLIADRSGSGPQQVCSEVCAQDDLNPEMETTNGENDLNLTDVAPNIQELNSLVSDSCVSSNITGSMIQCHSSNNRTMSGGWHTTMNHQQNDCRSGAGEHRYLSPAVPIVFGPTSYRDALDVEPVALLGGTTSDQVVQSVSDRLPSLPSTPPALLAPISDENVEAADILPCGVTVKTVLSQIEVQNRYLIEKVRRLESIEADLGIRVGISRADCERLEAENNNKDDEIRRLRILLKQESNKANALTVRLKDSLHRNHGFEVNLAAKDSELTRLFHDKSQQKERLRIEIERLQADLVQCRQELADRDEIVGSLQKSNKQCQIELCTTRSTLNAQSVSLESTQHELDLERQKSMTTTEECKTEISVMLERVKQAEKARNDVEARLMASEEISRQSSICHDEKIASLAGEIDALMSEIELLDYYLLMITLEHMQRYRYQSFGPLMRINFCISGMTVEIILGIRNRPRIRDGIERFEKNPDAFRNRGEPNPIGNSLDFEAPLQPASSSLLQSSVSPSFQETATSPISTWLTSRQKRRAPSDTHDGIGTENDRSLSKSPQCKQARRQ